MYEPHNGLDEALKANEHTAGSEAGAPDQGYPPQPIGYPGPPPVAGQPPPPLAAYPPQQHPAEPHAQHAHQQPTTIFNRTTGDGRGGTHGGGGRYGGTEDEKVSIRDDGFITNVPHLIPPRVGENAPGVYAIFICIGASTFGIGILVAITASPIFSIFPFLMSAVIFGLVGCLCYSRAKQTHASIEAKITPDGIDRFVHEVIKVQATQPQIDYIRAALNRANPDSPHEFVVMKIRYLLVKGRERPTTVSYNMKFGTRNMPKGKRPQLHVFNLVHH